MRLCSGPLGVVRIRWGAFAAEAGVDAAAVVEVFDPGGDPGVDVVAGGEGAPVVVLGFEGGSQGFGHGVIPAHSGLSHRHGSFHGAHVGSQFLGGELCSPISIGHDPCGEGTAGGGGHVECGDDQSACCAARPWRIPGHGASARYAWRTGGASLARIAGRRIVRDSHPVQGCLDPTGEPSDPHGPQDRVRRAWPGAGACSGLCGPGGASTRQPPAHPHPHRRA